MAMGPEDFAALFQGGGGPIDMRALLSGKATEMGAPAMAAAAGARGAPMSGGWAGHAADAGSKSSNFMKQYFGKGTVGRGIAPFAGIMLLEALLSGGLDKHNALISQGDQQAGLEEMGEAMDPQSQYYEAMLPEVSQQEESSRMALMNTIMGNGSRTQLAEGQEQFGGV